MVTFHALLIMLIQGGKQYPKDLDRCLGKSCEPNTIKEMLGLG